MKTSIWLLLSSRVSSAYETDHVLVAQQLPASAPADASNPPQRVDYLYVRKFARVVFSALVACSLLSSCGNERLLVAQRVVSTDPIPAPTSEPVNQPPASVDAGNPRQSLPIEAGTSSAPEATLDAGPMLGSPCGPDCFCESVDSDEYMVCPQTLIIEFAQPACAENDMLLAKVDSGEENARLRRLADKYGFDSFALGAGDQAEEGHWVWDDGTVLWQGTADAGAAADAYVNWTTRAPDNKAFGQDCLAWSFPFEQWDDRHCQSPAYQACETPNLQAQCREDCRCADFGGHRYMFCDWYATWQQNLELCSKHGMFMVRVNNAQEDAWLWDQLRPTAAEGMWLGARDSAQEDLWVWNDGEAFFDRSTRTAIGGLYINFPANQPDDATRTEDRLAMLPSGEWDDVHFRLAIPFVCERY